MKEKGILGELQAFLRMKMVEKLRGTDLMPSAKNQHPTTKEQAISMIVCNYLKQHKMHYTLSVFASECASVQLAGNNLDCDITRQQVIKLLDINNLMSKFPADETNSILENLVDVCCTLGNKKSENRSSQHDLSNSGNKLTMNAQSQTDFVLVSQSAQTGPINQSTKTQTKTPAINPTPSSEADVVLQTRPYAINKAQQFNSQQEVNTNQESKSHDQNQRGRQSSQESFYNQRIQEALFFLQDLDSRLHYLDLKHQSIIDQSTPESGFQITA